MAQTLLAGEPDNFSARLISAEAPLANTAINETVNTVLKLAIYEANNRFKAKGCDKKVMINLLRDDLDRNFPKITKYMYHNIPFAGPSSYAKVPYGESVAYGRTTFSQSARVQVKDETFFIGFDKIDHFFSHGFLYWSITGEDSTLSPQKIKNALDLGTAQEEGPWGLKFTGVKSYADMSANYKGLSFWRDLFDGPSPLVECVDNKFVLKNNFAMENYFDSSMDESINCNSYATPEMLQTIKAFTGPNKISCPVSAEACANFVKNYPAEVAAKILHPLCLKSGTSQVEKASKLTSKDILDGVQGLFSGGGNLFDVMFPPKKNKPLSGLNNGGVMEK